MITLKKKNQQNNKEQKRDVTKGISGNSLMDNRYDRQVRLWGASTQQRLATTSVVCRGLSYGLTAELIKNLVLGGVGRVVLQEAAACKEVVVTQDDMLGNALLRSTDIGAVRAPLMAQRAAEMNPLVSVTATLSSSSSTAQGTTLFVVKEWIPSSHGTVHAAAPEVRMHMAEVEDHGGVTVAGVKKDLDTTTTCCWTFSWSMVSVAVFTDATVAEHPLVADARLAGSPTVKDNEEQQQRRTALQRKPWPYQLAVLLIAADLGGASLQQSFPSFAHKVGLLYGLRAQLQLTAIDDRTLQAVVAELEEDGAGRGVANTVAATVAGGMVAQQIITRVGRGRNEENERKGSSDGERTAVTSTEGPAPSAAATAVSATSLPEMFDWYAFGFADGNGECFVG